jgi:hypothetical protein
MSHYQEQLTRHKAVPLAATVLLMGCAATYQFTKNGATRDDLNRDMYQCTLEAAQAFPLTVAQEVTHGYTTPAQTACYKAVNGQYVCETSEGQNLPPSVTNVDVNADKRFRAVRQCMFVRGYHLERICPSGYCYN